MDPKAILESAALDLKSLSTSATADKIHMLEMVQIPLNMLLSQSITPDMKEALDSIGASIKADKEASAAAPEASVLAAEDLVLDLVRQCLEAMSV
jgi:hypothetical protein